MSRPRPEPVQVVKQRRDAVLKALVSNIPYYSFMGFQFDRRGDEVTAIMPYSDSWIGNPMLPALHGGASAAFLEATALIVLSWSTLWEDMESGALSLEELEEGKLPRLPKTIDFSVDYLRTGLPRDSYARATLNRSGRRYASVFVEAWQDQRSRPYVQATGHFLMPQRQDTI